MSDARTYTCSACRETFTAGWSEEEKLEEFKTHFGYTPAADDPVVCDDCYVKIMEFNEGPDWQTKGPPFAGDPSPGKSH